MDLARASAGNRRDKPGGRAPMAAPACSAIAVLDSRGGRAGDPRQHEDRQAAAYVLAQQEMAAQGGDWVTACLARPPDHAHWRSGGLTFRTSARA